MQVGCVGSSVEALMEERFWQWQGRGEGPAARGKMATMQKLHSVCCQSGYPMYRLTGLGSTVPHVACWCTAVVQAFTIASHHSAPPALPHWHDKRRSPPGISCPSSSGCTLLCNSLPEKYLGKLSLHQYCWWHVKAEDPPAQGRPAPSIPGRDMVLTSFTLWSIGCSHSLLTSQWLSKKVRMSAVATSAPRTRERISPTVRKGHRGAGRSGRGTAEHPSEKILSAAITGEEKHTNNDFACHFCPCHWASIWFLLWW